MFKAVKRPLAFILVAFALAGCGGTTSGAGAGGAEIVPADAPMYIAINSDADSEQWQAVNDLSNRFADKGEALKSVKESIKQ
jgi:predicted small secreted protein